MNRTPVHLDYEADDIAFRNHVVRIMAGAVVFAVVAVALAWMAWP